MSEIRTVADLMAALSLLPGDTVVLVDGYEGGFTTLSAAVTAEVQQLERHPDQATYLGPFELVDEARRQAALLPTDPELAIGGITPPELVGEPIRVVVLHRSGR